MSCLWRTLIVLSFVALATSARAQSSDGFFGTLNKSLGVAETRGQGLLLQRCSLCHLRQLPRTAPPRGPVLTTLHLTTPQAEAQFRQKVLEGSSQMPAYKYTLQPKDIDDLVAYFKAAR
jgi:mono/diheme cytochrome c family protein